MDEGRANALLADLGAEALLIVAADSSDPDAAAFCREAHLGDCFVLARPGDVRLGFLSPIEREEAGRSGLALLGPGDLEVARATREAKSPGEAWCWILQRAFQRIGLNPCRVALAGHFANGDLDEALAALRGEGWTFASGHRAVLRMRKRKTDEELEEIRKSASATCAAFRRVAEILAAADAREGELWWSGARLSVGVIRREVALHFASAGLTEPEGNLIAPGREGAVPHNVGRDESILRPGESLVVDLFPRGRLFADCTRTFCVGPAGDALARAHREVEAALHRATDAARAGARGWDLQEDVCRYFEGQGRASVLSDPGTTHGYVHGLGHGVGFDVHEYPEFRRETPPEIGNLESGDVITLEPGLYEPEEGWAVRLEDLLHVTATGVENLTPLPYALDPRAWKRDGPQEH